jgi:hypothetical protein
MVTCLNKVAEVACDRICVMRYENTAVRRRELQDIGIGQAVESSVDSTGEIDGRLFP